MKISAICGMHTSGKSKVIQYLVQQRYRTYPEIAQALIDRGIKLAMNGTEDLQRIIMKEEFERDKRLSDSDWQERVFIETWHIGNLAHCRVIAPNLYSQYLNRIKSYELLKDAECFYLDIDMSKVRARTKLHKSCDIDEAMNFHKRVGQNILSIIKELKLPYHVIDANQEFADVFKQIKKVI